MNAHHRHITALSGPYNGTARGGPQPSHGPGPAVHKATFRRASKSALSFNQVVKTAAHFRLLRETKKTVNKPFSGAHSNILFVQRVFGCLDRWVIHTLSAPVTLMRSASGRRWAAFSKVDANFTKSEGP